MYPVTYSILLPLLTYDLFFGFLSSGMTVRYCMETLKEKNPHVKARKKETIGYLHGEKGAQDVHYDSIYSQFLRGSPYCLTD